MLVDANILIYAHDDVSPHYSTAQEWLGARLTGAQRVGIPWVSVLAFVRVMTNPRITRAALSPAEAWGHVETWFSSPSAWVPEPTSAHLEVLGGFVTRLGLTGNLVTDAHLAALAVEHGLQVCSADSDFARFPGVRWLNPVAPA